MITLIQFAYLIYWWNTFMPAADSGEVYRQRLCVTAAMLVFLLVVGEYASKQFGSMLCGTAIAAEITCFVLAALDLDERLFPRSNP
jgi:small neutral amino acid transporter SnatA (MarC family)